MPGQESRLGFRYKSSNQQKFAPTASAGQNSRGERHREIRGAANHHDVQHSVLVVHVSEPAVGLLGRHPARRTERQPRTGLGFWGCDAGYLLPGGGRGSFRKAVALRRFAASMVTMMPSGSCAGGVRRQDLWD